MNITTWTSPGSAVILDTETTDLNGRVIEVAVIDVATGAVLLDTLVNPGGAEISVEARAVHQISDQMLTRAPRWADVLPRLKSVIGPRTILAYNAAFDRLVIERSCREDGIEPGDLVDPCRWGCILAARTDVVGSRLRLSAGHRALGDCLAARAVLHEISAA